MYGPLLSDSLQIYRLMQALKKGFWVRLLETKRPAWLLAALLVNGTLILYTTLHTFQTFPISPDEYVYQISAELFSTGKLSVPSPEPRSFFDTLNVVNNGAYYGKYPPGWPLLLAIGIYSGLPWLVNPIFAILTLIILFAISRTLFPPIVANLTMILTLACPFLIFNSACLLSHASCLLLLTLAAFFLLKPEKNLSSFLGIGMTAGFAFLIRPLTSLLVLAPLILYFVIYAIRQRKYSLLRGFLFGTGSVFSIFLFLFLLYNYALTGHFLLQPFEVYYPLDRLGFFHNTWKEYSDRLNLNIIDRGLLWLQWTSGMPLMIILFLTLRRTHDRVYGLGALLAVPALCLYIGYYFYVGSGIFQYGPRYLYESYALMLIPAALGVLVLGRWAPLVLAVFLTLNGLKFHHETVVYRRVSEQGVQFFEKLHHLSNAIVFIRTTDNKDSAYFIRNDIHFDGPELLLLDYGDGKNQEAIHFYQGRSFYRCIYDSQNGQYQIKPY